MLIASFPLAASAGPERPASDSKEYPCDTFGLARSYTLKQELVGDAALGSFARLTEQGRAALKRLRAASALVSEVRVAGSRVLWSLSPHHPLGPLKLVLVDGDPGRLVVLDGHPGRLVAARGEARKKYELPLERLPDLLDGGSRTERTRHTLSLEPGAIPADAVPDKGTVALDMLSATVGLRRAAAPGGRQVSDLRLDVRLFMAQGPRRLPHREPLLALALPLLLDSRGAGLMETLAHAAGRPLSGWSVRVSGPGTGATGSARLAMPEERTLLSSRGWVRIPLCRLSTVRPAYAEAGGQPSLESAGKQLIKADDLKDLRTAAPAGPLTVENRSPSAAMIYLDGALLGWVAPFKKHGFKGIPAGFYRVYARTPLGTGSWGPYDLYVPGPVVLR